MSKKVEIEVFKYDELSDEAKSVARDWYRQGGLDYEWWDCIYEDAARFGIKIKGFELDCSWNLEAEFKEALEDIADKFVKVLPKDQDLYILAEQYLKNVGPLLATIVAYGNGDLDGDTINAYTKYENVKDQLEDLDREFKYAIKQEYLTMLQKEEEWLTSDEATEENIRANDYDFTADGKMW